MPRPPGARPSWTRPSSWPPRPPCYSARATRRSSTCARSSACRSTPRSKPRAPASAAHERPTAATIPERVMRVAVVANPTSGRGKGAKLIPQVDALLRSLNVDHVMRICTDGSDPERLARQAAGEGFRVVAALGGDGQVGLVANGLIGSDAALAVIPAGTGND